MRIVPGSKLEVGSQTTAGFIDDLNSFASKHTTAVWTGTFAGYLQDILPANPYRLTRSSHQYIYDMLCWYQNMRCAADGQNDNPKDLFTEDLFGINDSLQRVGMMARSMGTASRSCGSKSPCLEISSPFMRFWICFRSSG